MRVYNRNNELTTIDELEYKIESLNSKEYSVKKYVIDQRFICFLIPVQIHNFEHFQIFVKTHLFKKSKWFYKFQIISYDDYLKIFLHSEILSKQFINNSINNCELFYNEKNDDKIHRENDCSNWDSYANVFNELLKKYDNQCNDHKFLVKSQIHTFMNLNTILRKML